MRIMFLCTGNSCRSQMAEYLARTVFAEEKYRVLSSGTDPQEVHPYTHRVLGEVGIDSSDAHAKTIDAGEMAEFDLVITLCGDARDNCPILPSTVRQVHWPIKDPAACTGPENCKMEAFRRVRDELHERIRALHDCLGGKRN